MNWNEYFSGFAKHAALKSKDSTQVGAALVGPDGEVRLTGFNGPPKGVTDFAARRERPTKYLFASHAEANLIAFAAREGIRTKGCTVYVTHAPCASCARTLIQAGIVKVVAGPGTTSMPDEEFAAARTMFEEAGVVVDISKPESETPLHMRSCVTCEFGSFPRRGVPGKECDRCGPHLPRWTPVKKREDFASRVGI